MCGKFVKMAPNVLAQVLLLLSPDFCYSPQCGHVDSGEGVGPILELTVVSRMTKQNYYARALTWKTYGSSSNTNTIYRPDSRQQHHQKYTFLFYSVGPKLSQMPTREVYLNVEFTECEIVKLNQMKSWLVSAGGDWSCLIVPRLERFCPQLSPHNTHINFLY